MLGPWAHPWAPGGGGKILGKSLKFKKKNPRNFLGAPNKRVAMSLWGAAGSVGEPQGASGSPGEPRGVPGVITPGGVGA